MRSFSSFWWMVFTVPTVPTGIKMGVSISPWAVCRIPARAEDLLSVCNSLKLTFQAAKIRINNSYLCSLSNNAQNRLIIHVGL